MSVTHTDIHVPFLISHVQVLPLHSLPLIWSFCPLAIYPIPNFTLTLFLPLMVPQTFPDVPLISVGPCFSYPLSSSKTYKPYSIPHAFFPVLLPLLLLSSLHSTPFFLSPSHFSCPTLGLPLPGHATCPLPHFLSFHPHSLLLSLFLRSLHSSSSPPSHYNAPPSSAAPPSIHS